MELRNKPQKKSLLIAYLCWLIGGVFGLHHFYLNRDRHAFVWWTTFGGGFGIGWIGEIFQIPRYVRSANEDPEYMKEYIERLRKNKTPPFSTNRFTGMIMVAYMWGQMFQMAIPQDEFGGVNWLFLNWLTAIPVAVGVWTVGNIGKEKGTIWMPLLGAFVCSPIRYYIYDESLALSAMVIVSALAFDGYSKQWRRNPPKQKSFTRRMVTLSCCAILYLSLWCGYIYFNGSLTDSDGNEVPIHEAFHHFFTSPWWIDLQQSLYDTYQFAQHHGWYEIWKQIIDLTDPLGEQNAYKLLGVGPDSSQQEITAAWRKLSKESHPDKVKNESQRKEAQEKFMEIQQAYEILSKNKNRRYNRNKKDNSEL